MQAQDAKAGDQFFFDLRVHTVTKKAALEPNADGGDPIFAIVTAKPEGSDVSVPMCFGRFDALPPLPNAG